MSRSWELPDDMKKEVQQKQAEIGEQYDPETGRRKGEAENTGESEDVEGMDGAEESRDGRNRSDDENIR